MKDCQKRELIDKILKYKEQMDGKKVRSEQRNKEKKDALAQREKEIHSKGKSSKGLNVSR